MAYPDEQDQAETFDETNITRDGEDIATPDMAAGVYDATHADDDDDIDGVEAADDDFDPDDMDEEEVEVTLEMDGGVDEERSFKPSGADRVGDDDDQPARYEAEGRPRRREEDDEDLGFDDERKPPEHDPHVEKQLDHGLEETFPASDPVSINPGAD